MNALDKYSRPYTKAHHMKVFLDLCRSSHGWRYLSGELDEKRLTYGLLVATAASQNKNLDKLFSIAEHASVEVFIPAYNYACHDIEMMRYWDRVLPRILSYAPKAPPSHGTSDMFCQLYDVIRLMRAINIKTDIDKIKKEVNNTGNILQECYLLKNMLNLRKMDLSIFDDNVIEHILEKNIDINIELLKQSFQNSLYEEKKAMLYLHHAPTLAKINRLIPHIFRNSFEREKWEKIILKCHLDNQLKNDLKHQSRETKKVKI